MANKIVKLSRSYTAHNKTFDSIELREPTFKDIYMSGLGQPFEWQMAGDRNPVRIVYPETVAAYVDRLCINPTAECIDSIVGQDAIALASAVIDFFTPEPKTSPTTSSSGSDGTQPASSA